MGQQGPKFRPRQVLILGQVDSVFALFFDQFINITNKHLSHSVPCRNAAEGQMSWHPRTGQSLGKCSSQQHGGCEVDKSFKELCMIKPVP